jgi:hypothetical protein
VTPPDRHQPTASARAATWLLGLFLVAILGALGVTVDEVPGARVVALASVVPIILLTSVFIVYSRRGRPWAYAGGSAVGMFGVALRIAVSTHPSLEVGGGLPIEVTALYSFLGVSVVVTNLVAALASGHASTSANGGR